MAEYLETEVETTLYYECDNHAGVWVLETDETKTQGNKLKYKHLCPVDQEIYWLDKKYPIVQFIRVDSQKVINFLT